MSDLCTAAENAILSAFFPPTGLYLALATAVTDGEAGTFTEVSGGGYARQPITFSAPANGVVSNTARIEFPLAMADYGTVTHVFLMTALTGGDARAWKALTPAISIVGGIDRFMSEVGGITFTLD